MFQNRIDRWFAEFRATGEVRALAEVFDRAELTADSADGTMEVRRGGRTWFCELVADARKPYRVGLPAGDYVVVFWPRDATRESQWRAACAVGATPLQVDLKPQR